MKKITSLILLLLFLLTFKTPTNANSVFQYIPKIVINDGYIQELIDGIEYNGEIYISIKDISKYSSSSLKYNSDLNILKVLNNGASGKYEGDYVNGLYHGVGKLIFSDGSIYKGSFREGVIQGEGTMYYSSGEIYIGTWENGLRSGKGELHWPDGRTYIGSFKEGFMSGKGSLYYKNGDKYYGEFQYNYIHGRGKMEYRSGDNYDGMWKYGLYDGEGILLEDNNRTIGIWSKGQFVKRKLLKELIIEID